MCVLGRARAGAGGLSGRGHDEKGELGACGEGGVRQAMCGVVAPVGLTLMGLELLLWVSESL